MANLTSVLLPIFITGDGVSTTAVVDLNSTAYTLSGIQNLSAAPVSVALDSAFNALGAVNTNVASVTLLGSQVTITFTAPFSGTVGVNLALKYPIDGSPLTTPVNQFVKVTSSTLPAGAATEATLAARTKPSDTQLVDGSAHTQPVSGTFWPVTQPISAAVLPLPAGATTEATLALVKAQTDNIDVALSTRTKPSDVQQVRALTASDVVTAQQGTPPWSTVFSVPQHVINDASSAVIGHVITDTGSTTAVTQTTTPWVTRETKDTGRTALSLFVDNIAGSASEVLATMSITKGAAAQIPATSYTVTAGKTLRLTSMNFTVRSSTNSAQLSQLRVRTAASGITTTSPIILNFIGEAPAAAVVQQSMDFPDGYEIAGSTQIAMSHVESITPTSTLLTVCLVGYEY